MHLPRIMELGPKRPSPLWFFGASVYGPSGLCVCVASIYTHNMHVSTLALEHGQALGLSKKP